MITRHWLPCIEESIPLYVKAAEFHQGLDHLWLFTPETSDQLEVKTEEHCLLEEILVQDDLHLHRRE